MLTEKTLRRLLWGMSQPRTFYVLGAGASYGLIPVTKDLRRSIETEYHSPGVYQVTRAPPSPLFERLIGEISPNEDDRGQGAEVAHEVGGGCVAIAAGTRRLVTRATYKKSTDTQEDLRTCGHRDGRRDVSDNGLF